MSTGKKLAIGVGVVAGVTIYMAYLGAATSWRYYLTVDECLATERKLPEDRIRVSGKIAPNTLSIAADRGQAEFSLEGTASNLAVICSGPFPDKLAEGTNVVVEGRLEGSGLLRAHKVLTRCAGKYESRPRTASLRDAPSSGPGGNS